MRIPASTIKTILHRLAIAIAAIIYSTSPLASGNCETSIHIRESHQGSTGISSKTTKYTFNSLNSKIYTKEKLEDLLKYIRSGQYDSRKHDEIGVTTSEGDPSLVEPGKNIDLLRAFECHQRAGWPSAIDYSPPLAGSQSKTALLQPQSPPKNAARENSSSDMTKLTDTQEKMGNEEREAIAIAAQDVRRSSKKILLPDLGSKCLRTVDIREDSDVRGMYWFALENICSEPVKAHWCDIKVCKGTNMAATIAPGGKEKSWTSIYKSGRHPNQLKGVACQVEYKNAPVYKDPQTNKCYSWSHQVQ